MKGQPLLATREISMTFGGVRALDRVSFEGREGEVTCLLGDNGAGKTTLIKILSGVHHSTGGEILLEGEPLRLDSPRDALERGITTVFQDLALAPLMSVWRNFFLGSERRIGQPPLRRLDTAWCRREARDQLARLGIRISDTSQPAGTLSGGERQSLAIARALHRGGRVLILDEPTAALGVRQTRTLLHLIVEAKEEKRAVILVTHNPHHALPVGDHFVVLRQGRVVGDREKDELALDELIDLMSGSERPERGQPPTGSA